MMRKTVWTLMLSFLVALPFMVQDVSAQTTKKNDVSKKKKQSFVLKATKVETTRGNDPNIKDDNVQNDANAEFPGPAAKGTNTNTRGSQGVCRVVLDNRTKLKIKIYVDGTFRGVMAPWGDSEVYVQAGETSVYARAEFTDGSALNWGPKVYDCYSGQFIYFRMDP